MIGADTANHCGIGRLRGQSTMRIGREHTICPVCSKALILDEQGRFRRHVRRGRRLSSGRGIRCPASQMSLAIANGIAASEKRRVRLRQ
jgi:hypothetical protein